MEEGLDQFYRWELTNRCNINYMTTQLSLTESMRTILIDWLIDVSVHFEVTDDTLHLTVGLIDRVLSKISIDRSKLQLVGVTCMKIADVLFEKSKEYYRQENSIEYAYITADEYTPAEVVKMEALILDALNFKLLTPTILSFLKPLLVDLQIDEETCGLAHYLADLMLLSYDCVTFRPSVLASAILYWACCSVNRFPNLDSLKIKHSRDDFLVAADCVKGVWLDARSGVFSRYESINHKFQAINPTSIWPPASQLERWTL